MISLKNNTKSNSKPGYAVIVDPRDSHAFLYAVPGSSKVIGVVMESVSYRGMCKIATLGDKAKVYVSGNVVKGDILRLSKTTDRASLGASVIAKTGDVPYVRIGEALNAGRGLISCVLDLSYISSLNDSLGSGAIPDGTYTVGLGIFTDGIIEIRNGIIISLIEAT